MTSASAHTQHLPAMYSVFDPDSYWGSHPHTTKDSAQCSCHDVSFGGITELDPAAAETEPFPTGSIGYRLDQLMASRGRDRKIQSTQTGSNSGFAWDAADGNVHFISDGALSIAMVGSAKGFEGEEDEEAGLCSAERSAWSLLGFYFDHCDEETNQLLDSMMAGLNSLSGSFSFVLHDRRHHRVLAARDRDGGAMLLWGEGNNGIIQFSTTCDSAVDDTVDAFPPGCVFLSAVGNKEYEVFVKKACPGRLVSFNKQLAPERMKRVRSRGTLGKMTRSTSGVDMALIKTYAKGAVRESPSFSDLMTMAE